MLSLQQMCALLEKCVESVCVNNTLIREETIEFSIQNTKLECRQLVHACQNAARIVQALNQEVNHQTITHKVIINFKLHLY